jgi:hypothetical protein
MPRPPPLHRLYVRHLFRLLQSLGIGQQDVVRALGAAKALVSYWATGKKHVSPPWQRPLPLFVQQELVKDWEKPRALSERAEHLTQVNAHLTAWYYEVLHGWNWMDRRMDAHLSAITALHGQAAEKLTPEELRGLEHNMREWLRYKRHRDLAMQRTPAPPGERGIQTPPKARTFISRNWFFGWAFRSKMPLLGEVLASLGASEATPGMIEETKTPAGSI